jgi:hypothetical protein
MGYQDRYGAHIDFVGRLVRVLVETAEEDRLNISPWPGEIYGCFNLARAKRVEKDHPFS